MTEATGTPRARALAGAMRQARETAKERISVREVARRLEMAHSVVSNWETGKKVPSLEDVASYLTAIGVTGDERKRVLDLGRHADDQDWLAVGIPGITQQLAGTMECERGASSITEWSLYVLPGLLQTSAYARAIIGDGDLPKQEIEARILIRMGRRDVIQRSNPVHLTALIHEGALRETVGGPQVMADQLKYLNRTAEEESVTVLVVSKGLGFHAGLEGPFVLYDFDNAPSIVLLEHHRTGAFVYGPDDIDEYKKVADTLRQLAMSPEASARLIAEIAHEMESTT